MQEALRFGDLAATLARVLGDRAVVCLGCPVAGRDGDTASLVIYRPPLVRLPLRPRRVLLAVLASGGGERPDLSFWARAGVPQVWLVDDEHGWMESFERPRAGLFRHRGLFYAGDTLPLAAFPDVEPIAPSDAGRRAGG